MNADNVNKWLTLSANIGVVIGLMLLLVELNQNRDLVRAQIHQDRSDAWVANRFARADSEFVIPVLEKLYVAGFPDNLDAMQKLTPVDRRRLYDVLDAFSGDYDNMFFQYQQGYLDEEFYRAKIETSIRELAPWWKKYAITGRPSFEKEIDRIMSGS